MAKVAIVAIMALAGAVVAEHRLGHAGLAAAHVSVAAPYFRTRRRRVGLGVASVTINHLHFARAVSPNVAKVATVRAPRGLRTLVRQMVVPLPAALTYYHRTVHSYVSLLMALMTRRSEVFRYAKVPSFSTLEFLLASFLQASFQALVYRVGSYLGASPKTPRVRFAELWAGRTLVGLIQRGRFSPKFRSLVAEKLCLYPSAFEWGFSTKRLSLVK
jgi:hypothetical protein